MGRNIVIALPLLLGHYLENKDMGHCNAMPLADAEGWWRWFESRNYSVRLFRDDPQAAVELKQRIDPMFWANEFVTGRLNGLVEVDDERVLIQIAEHRSRGLPVGMVAVAIWPVPFEKGKRQPDKENLRKNVLVEFEARGLRRIRLE